MTINSPATFPEFALDLREFMLHSRSTKPPYALRYCDNEFDALARSLFTLQFNHNAPYRRFCEARNVTPQTVAHWTQIPAVPTAAFKEFELTCLQAHERAREFHSSGTTGQRPSRHYHNADSLALYQASLLPWFTTNLLPEDGSQSAQEMSFVFLTPNSSAAPHSSLVYMFETIRRELASSNAHFTGVVASDGAWTVDVAATLKALRETIAAEGPVIVLGTAFNFVHLLDGLRETGVRLQLPRRSRVMETGGYKGRSRALPKTELHRLISDAMGIATSDIICEYGMSELSSQAYDSTSRVFHFPPWARVQIISPETGREVAEGQIGLIRVFDLANVYSVMAIQTEDLGERRGGGFELLGRAALSEPRGCSLQSV